MTTSTQPSLVEAFGSLPTANVADAQERFGVAHGLHPVWKGARVVGPAFTVWTRPGDNLFLIRALDQAQPGDVIVVNGHGDTSRALIGDLIAGRAKKAGIAGFVIDGAVRDVDTLAEIGLPVFARGVSPAGPYKNGPGRIQVPVAISGVVVTPGDVIVADSDGVVVVLQADVFEVLAEAEAIRIREEGYRA